MSPNTVPFIEGVLYFALLWCPTANVGGQASNTHVWMLYGCGPMQEVKKNGGDSGSWLLLSL